MDERGSDAFRHDQSDSTAEHDEQSLANAWRWLLSETGDETRKQQLLSEGPDGSPEALLTIANFEG